MCIAIVKPRGVSLAEDRLRVCFENNPDGAGFAIATDKGVVIQKGYTTFQGFLTAYREHQVDKHLALVHFRITTRGEQRAQPPPLPGGGRRLGPQRHHRFTPARQSKGPSDTACSPTCCGT